MRFTWIIGLKMQEEPVHLADLYQFDEIYWTPQDKPNLVSKDLSTLVSKDSSNLVSKDSSTLVSLDSSTLVSKDSSTLVSKDSSNLLSKDSSNLVPQDSSTLVSVEGNSVEPAREKTQIFESAPTLDQAVLSGLFTIKSPWVIVGNLPEAERSRLDLILMAPPLLLAPQDWSVYTPDENEPGLTEFVQKCAAKKFVFLGQQPAVWQSDFQVTELVQMEGKMVYFFPRLISTLTDADKSLKLVFWNALKSML